MAGYSGTPLVKKLGVRPGFKVALVGAPKDFEDELGELPEGAKINRDPRGVAHFDVWIVFVKSSKEFGVRFANAAERLGEATGGGVWVCWPKKASGVKTDLTENAIRDAGLFSGLVDNKVCAVDETWSGLRFVKRREK
jgi:hypothetical protein